MIHDADLKTREFDIANYIEDEEDVLAYLQLVIADHGDDPKEITTALNHILRAQNRMAKVAADASISRPAIYKALSPTGNPSLATFVNILHALGLSMDIKKAAA